MATKDLPKKFQGESVEKAIEKATAELGVNNKKDLDYKIIDKGGKTGGFFRKKKKPAVIEVISIKDSGDDEKETEASEDSTPQEDADDNLSEDDYELLDKSIDGYYRFLIDDEKTLLTVHPPMNDGKDVKWMDVKSYLEKNDYKILEEEPIVEVVRDAKGEPVDISEYVEEIIEDGRFEVRTEEKNMKALLRVELPRGRGKRVTAEDITNYLKEREITHGLKKEEIEKAVKEGTKGDFVDVAEGTPPVKGKDAEIQEHFEHKEAKPVIKEDGTVDYYNVENITNVAEGDILAARVPPEDGIPGVNVYGEEVPPEPPKDKLLKIGKNVVHEEENDVLKAAIDGQVVQSRDGTINVYEVYEISGDLDISIGNIEFTGNVVVKGSVKSNLSIRTDGDVEIGKSADNCFIEAGGDVHVKGGIQGKSKGQVKSDGNITCKFIENANVIAGGDVTVAEAIMHSNVRGQNVYVIQGKRGLLVGGKVVASEEVHAKTIGSNLATSTTIEVGLAPEIRDKIEELKDEHEKAVENLEKTQKAIKMLEKLKQTQGQLPPDKEKILTRFNKTEGHLKERLNAVEEEKEKYEKKLEECTDGKVKAYDVVYPGVKVMITNLIRNNDEVKRKVTFYLNEDGEIRAE